MFIFVFFAPCCLLPLIDWDFTAKKIVYYFISICVNFDDSAFIRYGICVCVVYQWSALIFNHKFFVVVPFGQLIKVYTLYDVFDCHMIMRFLSIKIKRNHFWNANEGATEMA